MSSAKPFRVLSLDGGGMRGTYTAAYLHELTTVAANRRGVPKLDLGKAFDLIVGTSTGGIIACALMYGVPLQRVVDLYTKHGHQIFQMPMRRTSLGELLLREISGQRSAALGAGAAALRRALDKELGSTTLFETYERRGIALAVPAVALSHHRSWVFKTPHLAGSNGRDNKYKLVEICMATSAAPIYRSLAAVDDPSGHGSYQVFADGGLWANNPVMVGLVDAVQMADPDQEIEIFCLGACPRPAGQLVPKQSLNRSIYGWRCGADVVSLSIDAQEFAYDNMARLLCPHLKNECSVIRFPRESVPANFADYLDLDETRDEAKDALLQMAKHDADMTNSRMNDSNDCDAQRIQRLFMAANSFEA